MGMQKRYCLEYTVEITPNTEAPIKSAVYFEGDTWKRCAELEELLTSDPIDLEKEKLFWSSSTDNNINKENDSSSARKYNVQFDGLEYDKEYKIIFSTELDGRTVAQQVTDFKCFNEYASASENEDSESGDRKSESSSESGNDSDKSKKRRKDSKLSNKSRKASDSSSDDKKDDKKKRKGSKS